MNLESRAMLHRGVITLEKSSVFGRTDDMLTSIKIQFTGGEGDENAAG